MAASRSILALLAAGCTLALAQEPPSGGPAPKADGPPPKGDGPPRERPRWDGPKPDGGKPDGGRPDFNRRPPWMGKLSPEGEAMRDRAMKQLDEMTPEQRMEVWRSVMAVLKMTPEKRKEVLGLEDERVKHAREEIETALKENGITVPDDRKREFFHRYFHERRTIEETLRKEGDERRAALLKTMHEKLKKDFSAQPPAAPAEVEKK